MKSIIQMVQDGLNFGPNRSIIARQSQHPNSPILAYPLPSSSRRTFLTSLTVTLGVLQPVDLVQAATSTTVVDRETKVQQHQRDLDLERTAVDAYSRRDFVSAIDTLDTLISRDPENPRFREMRAQALVDGKEFSRAIREFDECLGFLGTEPTLDRARVLSGRGLALEGLGDWVGALEDYDKALDMATSLGADPDPYVLNSRGNCHASLGEWSAARADYLASANGFQTARREDRYSGRLQQRLDGAIFAFSNAALMLAAMGDDEKAVKEMQDIARRAPGSADIRAALAAELWAVNEEELAESAWEFACTNITVGCAKYRDRDWLSRIRRWPPVMVDRLEAFLRLRSNTSPVRPTTGATTTTPAIKADTRTNPNPNNTNTARNLRNRTNNLYSSFKE